MDEQHQETDGTKKQWIVETRNKCEQRKYISLIFTVYQSYYNKLLYPYHCDYYLPKYDLYIELNAMWTHGPHPFNDTDEDDLKLLNIWKNKAVLSKYYQHAIYQWTELDLKKIKIAKTNKLLYLPIYSNNYNEIVNIIQTYINKNYGNI